MFTSTVAGNPFREMAFEPVSTRTHGSRYKTTTQQNNNEGSSSSSPPSTQDGRPEQQEGNEAENMTTEPSNTPNPSPVWPQRALPGGRRLWRRLVIGFAFVATLGGVFVTLGAVYFREANAWSKKEGMTMPLVMCILAIVIGALFIVGSIILGKLIISDKWRKNQQPTYRNLALPSVRFQRSRPPENSQVQIQMEPPSYEASMNDSRTPPANIFIISGQEVNVNMVGRMAPPPYSEQNPDPSFTEQNSGPDPPYSEQNPGLEPSYTERNPSQDPPEYTETPPGGDTVHQPPEGSTTVTMAPQNVLRVLSGRRSLTEQESSNQMPGNETASDGQSSLPIHNTSTQL